MILLIPIILIIFFIYLFIKTPITNNVEIATYKSSEPSLDNISSPTHLRSILVKNTVQKPHRNLQFSSNVLERKYSKKTRKIIGKDKNIKINDLSRKKKRKEWY